MIDRVRTKKTHPALKHGVYSAAAILPGENRAEFERGYIKTLLPNYALMDRWRMMPLPNWRAWSGASKI